MLKSFRTHEPGLLSPRDLFLENRQLRQQLQELMANARRNERKFKRAQNQELRLISSASLAELVDNLLIRYRESSHLEWVTLTLIDPEYEIQRLLTESGGVAQPRSGVFFLRDDQHLRRLFHSCRRPVLGAYEAEKHSMFFPESRLQPHSVALLPLCDHNRLRGCICLGSRQEQRFLQSDGTDFLERLSAIFPLCLENTLNQDRLKKVGLTDPLTGVNNRRYFDQRLTEEIVRTQRHKKPLTCLFLDVDRFKSVNDTHGHQVGDQVLAQTAVLIRNQLRVTDVLARYGGEEFAALLADTDVAEAREVAERIRYSVEQYLFLLPAQLNLRITLSIGIATFTGAVDNAEIAGQQLIADADQALYAAKNGGRNCIITA